MSIITKIIGMVALGHTAVETRIAVQNFLTGLIGALALALASGLMIGALLIGLHVSLYMILAETTDLTSLQALGVTLLLGFLVTAGVVLATITRAKESFTFGKQLNVENYQPPVSSRVVGIAEAFFDGLTGRSRYR